MNVLEWKKLKKVSTSAIGKSVLFKGNCLDILPIIPDKSIDFVCCDLPYGVTANKKDIVIPFNLLWEQYERIIKDNGCIALFAQGLFYIDLVNSNRRLFKYDLVWDKILTSGFLNAKRMPLRQHEQIAIFYKKMPTYNPQYTEGKPLHGKGSSFKTKKVQNKNYGDFSMVEDKRAGSTQKYPTTILRFQKPHPSVALHRTEKSIPCLEWLISTYTNKGDVVLDNCMGSGTCGVACLNTGRKFIGIELDKHYYKVARNRIKESFLK